MFGFLKNLMRKPAGTPVESDETSAAESAEYNDQGGYEEPVPAPAPKPARHNGGFGNGTRQNGGHQNGGNQPAGHQPAGYRPAGQQPTGRSIEIPLQAILESLPLELQPRVRIKDVGDATILIPLEKILSQISRGCVKIPYGELRQNAPEVFSSENDSDRVAVALPLAEVLPRLNPALITRRRTQRQIEIPNEISSPFDPKSQSVSNLLEPGKPEPARHYTPSAKAAP